MSPGSRLARLIELARTRPLAAALEVATLFSCVLLLVGTFVAIANGPPSDAGGIWMAIIILGTAVVLLWTVVVPAYERLRA